MTHIEEVTEGIMETFREMRAGAVDRADASEIANLGGKVISAYKTRLVYHGMRGEIPEIPGLGTTATAQRLAAE